MWIRNLKVILNPLNHCTNLYSYILAIQNLYIHKNSQITLHIQCNVLPKGFGVNMFTHLDPTLTRRCITSFLSFGAGAALVFNGKSY